MSSPYPTLSQELCSNRISAFRVENSSGNDFDLLQAGPTAANVPKEAITLDVNSPDIVFSNASMWSFTDSVMYYGRGLWYTFKTGASLNFSFDGEAIWYDCVSYT